MTRFKLRTQLVITTIVLIVALSGATLFIVQKTVRSEVNRQVISGLQASIHAFSAVEKSRAEQLSTTAALMSELPTLKALMATHDPRTVQDGSEAFWRLSNSDLLVLASPDGAVLAMHASKGDWTTITISRHLQGSVRNQEQSAWWFDGGRLYWVFLRPLRAGDKEEQRDLGIIAVGFEVDSRVAQELATSSRSDIVLTAGGQIIASTLPWKSTAQFQERLQSDLAAQPSQVALVDDAYQLGSVVLRTDDPAIRCFMLLPISPWRAFLQDLNRTTIFLAVATILVGGAVFTFISRAITRPLDNVVAALHALASGDYEYDVRAAGSTEVEQLATSFSTMRQRLLESQRHQAAAQRVAALGQTASSISHDLRHYLAAVVANAEFLYEAEALKLDRSEIYREILTASDQMLDLIESLRELSREETSIVPTPADLAEVIRKATDAVDARQDFRKAAIRMSVQGDMSGTFDARKMERVFFNLVLNSCEALAGREGNVLIDTKSEHDHFEVRVTDDGPGIPHDVRDTLFDPFVSAGKQNGTGLGLAIVSKIINEHRGRVQVISSSEAGTTILVRFPKNTVAPTVPSYQVTQGSL